LGLVGVKLLELIIKEFITIVERLEQDNPVENERIVIERDEFKKLLEKYAYATFKQKTKAYKDLNFIIHDKNNYTMPYKDRTTKKTVRKVIFNYRTYQTVKYMHETIINM